MRTLVSSCCSIYRHRSHVSPVAGYGVVDSPAIAGDARQGSARRRKKHPSNHRAKRNTVVPSRRGLHSSAASHQKTQQQSPAVVLPVTAARVIEDSDHGIRDHCIIPEAWHVLMRLRKQGHEVYVVGGTVRDVLLQQQMPKDVDILTSADPAQVARLFKRSFLLGKSFPICHVHVSGRVIEVSSFSTNTDPAHIPIDYATQAAFATRSKKFIVQNGPTWAMARRENAMKRDFTVNALLYDPFTRVLFDYVGGVEDCETQTLRTIQSPAVSFSSDPARMLRALRLAARLGLHIDPDTKQEILARRNDITSLSHGRLQMELNAMMAFGSAAKSFALLQEYGMVELLLPHHANVDSTVVTSMLSRMDAYARVDAPVDSIFWTSMLFAPLCAKNDDEYVDTVSLRLLSSPTQTVPCLLPRNSVEMAATIMKLYSEISNDISLLPHISEDEYIQERKMKKKQKKRRSKKTIKGLSSTEIVILTILQDYI